MAAEDDSRAGLTRRELERVLRRAGELEQRRGRPGDLLPVAEVERIGVEAGLSRDALRRALAELDAGVIDAAAAPSWLDRLVGPARLVMARRVPGPADAVRAQVDRFLREQLFRVKRNFGDRVLWEPALGFWPGLLRTFDWSKQYALGEGIEIESQVAPLDAGGRDVEARLAIDLAAVRRRRAWTTSAAASAVTVAALVAGAVAPVGHLASLAMAGGALALGGGVAAGSFAASRAGYRRALDRVRLGIERFFDALEHERE